MKALKLSAVVTALAVICALFAGCSEKDRLLYRSADLEKAVTLGEYKNIPVDLKSETVQGYIDDLEISDAQGAELYNELKTGKVEEGDIANIDYEGKKDGVAFEGGTAEGHDLEIGSGSFIDGFEDGLIGVSIGETVDLDLTFPEGYQNEELSGEDVVFTVKVNSVKRLKKAEETYSDLGFKTLADYEKDLEERAVKYYLIDTVSANSKVNDYPKEDIDYIYEEQKALFEDNLQSSYGMTLAQYLSYTGMSEDDFKEDFVENQVKPYMENQMVLYAIADRENIEITNDAVEKRAQEFVDSMNSDSITVSAVKEAYGEYYFEEMTVNEKVSDFLYENANIK